MGIENVHEKVVSARMVLGISQGQMADLLEMSQSNYGRLEKGSSKIYVDLLYKIASLIQVDITFFFDDTTYLESVIQKYYKKKQKEPDLKAENYFNETLKNSDKKIMAKILLYITNGRTDAENNFQKIIIDINTYIGRLPLNAVKLAHAYIQGLVDRQEIK